MVVLSRPQLERLCYGRAGPASADVMHGPVYEINPAFYQAHVKQNGGTPHFSYSALLKNSRRETDTLVPGRVYVTEIAAPPKEYRPRATGMRSGAARNGMMGKRLRGAHGKPDGVVPCLLRTYGPSVRIPDMPVMQVVLAEPGTRPLSAARVKHALEAGDLWLDDPLILADGGIRLRLGEGVATYTGDGAVLDMHQDSARYFSLVDPGNLVFQPGKFYIGSTEPVYVGPRHMGLLHGTLNSRRGVVHLNAPVVQPNSGYGAEGKGAPQMLEIVARRRLMPVHMQTPCVLYIYELSEPVSGTTTRYAQQHGAQTSLMHLGDEWTAR